MIDPTIEAVRAKIPPDALAYARALGEDWCHPTELRKLRALAYQAVPKLTPRCDPEGFQAGIKVSCSAPSAEVTAWLALTVPWTAFMRKLSTETAEDHLVYLIAGHLEHNFRMYEAPQLALESVAPKVSLKGTAHVRKP